MPIPDPETEIPTLTTVLTLGDGAAFGELALENNAPRAASILCTEDTHFAVLEKTDYQRILAKIVKEERYALVDFL